MDLFFPGRYRNICSCETSFKIFQMSDFRTLARLIGQTTVLAVNTLPGDIFINMVVLAVADIPGEYVSLSEYLCNKQA